MTGKLRVEVAVALPRKQELLVVELHDGATVEDALAASGARERFPEIDWAVVAYAVWSRPCAPGRPLRDGDRVEVLRPLAADPKDQRRTRARASPRSRNAP